MQIPLPSGLSPSCSDRRPLHFLVVGAGLVGLASACALRSVGHHVTVIEQQDKRVLQSCREAVRCPPTMTHIFSTWGLGHEFSNISTPIRQFTMLDGKSGELLDLIPIYKIEDALPADYRCTQYGSLFRLLRHLASKIGVRLHFNCTAVSIDPWSPSVTSRDGRLWRADVIIGADGTDSVVRPLVLTTVPAPEHDPIVTLLFNVPADIVRKDPDLAAVIDAKSWTGWFADDCSLHGILTGSGPGCDYALTMHITMHAPHILPGFLTSLYLLKLHLFEPRAQKLLKLANQLRVIPQFVHYRPFDDWVHESGKVVLVGEAAHPMPPTGSHNTCAGIEDALTLSMLLSLPATKSQTSMLLNVYEELRQPRSASVQTYVRQKRDAITVPLAQRRRDTLLRNKSIHQFKGTELDDDYLHSTYLTLVQINGFDTCEVVQDWWVKLGRSILIRSPDSESEIEDDDDNTTTFVPIFVDAEVERLSPKEPFISDLLLDGDDLVAQTFKAHPGSVQHRYSLLCFFS